MPAEPDEASSRHPPQHYAILLAGMLAVSTSSILIRLAVAPPLVIGAWRLLLAALFLLPVALPRARREWRGLGRREALALLGSGVALAAHFASWIHSLTLTTVASSTILVATNPIFVGLATRFLLKERIQRSMLIAIAITIAGSLLIGYGDIGLSSQALLGDLFALGGALAGSAYILLGQVVRARVSTLAYVLPCYALAGAILLLVCLASGQTLTGYAPQTMGVFVLLALVPQILGHSAYNWALGYFHPLVVTLALLGEPVGATALAWLVLGERPAALAYPGGLLIMAGIVVASLVESHSVRVAQSG